MIITGYDVFTIAQAIFAWLGCIVIMASRHQRLLAAAPIKITCSY
jgi:hypothetical protein